MNHPRPPTSLPRLGLATALALAAAACGASATSSGGGPKSGANDLLSFTVDAGVNFVVDQTQRTATAFLLVDGDIDIQTLLLTPTITVSPGATVSPASGQKEDFVKPVTYTVTAEDGSAKAYTVGVQQVGLPDTDQTASGGIPLNDPAPPASGTLLVGSLDGALTGTWSFAWSATLEIRQVGADTVLTLLELTPTTQTTEVQTNGVLDPPMVSSGTYGSTATFNADHTFSGSDDLGDRSTGTWKFTDLGAGQRLRYQLTIDETTTIPGGPSASGTITYGVTGLSAHGLRLTREPTVTSAATVNYDYLYQR
jgi:hypothetical protein